VNVVNVFGLSDTRLHIYSGKNNIRAPPQAPPN